MIIGIVGSEGAKFTPLGRLEATFMIQDILLQPGVTEVVSGKCHLGGIDIWAAEMGHVLGLTVTEYPPAYLTWEYYKRRNMQIVERSDVVYCITVRVLPPDFPGMRFAKCYHCGTIEHVKSGGCWTMKRARLAGKKGELKVVENL